MAVNLKQNGRLYAIIVIVTIALIAPFIYLAVKQSGQKAGTSTGEYYDPGSGETVSDPAGRTPENFAGNAEGPVYLGFSKLLDIGLTTYQLDAVKYTFEQYGRTSNQKIEEVSLTVNSLATERHNEEDPIPKDKVFFDVTINRKQTFKARVDYFDLTSVQLYLSDPKTGKVIYDSKVIDQNSDDEFGGDGVPPESHPH